MTYSETIRKVLDNALEKDNSVFLIGEDIADYGGAFGVTQGLFKKYGESRIINSPMSEATLTGLGIGAALNGLKPIIEIMFIDFITLSYDQLFNHASIFSHLTNGKCNVPLVIRTPYGGGRGYGSTHSKTIIAPLVNIPGIKIVAPSNAKDAGGLLKSAIKDNNPVIFLENKMLYSKKEEINEDIKSIPIGKAKIVKEGKDLLIITFGKNVSDCIEIANDFQDKEFLIEVLDLRTIKPLDIKTIIDSVERIGKVLIVEEGYSECGIASEIITQINENAFFSLDRPIERVCTLDVPIPTCIELEKVVIPSKKRIIEKINKIMNE